MPTNLPPDYYAEEKRLREAKTIDEKIAIIEKMIAIAPHHKGTDKLIGGLRSKIAKLKEEKERRPQSQKRAEALYSMKTEGAGQVLFVGYPNSGKSSLISALTGEPLEVADYPYTTRHLHQRMMRYEDIWIQLVDTPAFGDESQHMWFGNMVRHADVIVLVLALSDALDIEYELALEELMRHLGEKRKLVLVVNKLDLTEYAAHLARFEESIGKEAGVIAVSVLADVNLHELKKAIFDALGVIRVYSKLPGKKPDLDIPFTMRKGSTVVDCAAKIHKDFLHGLKQAKLWRKNKYNGMLVSKDFPLEDKDVLELHL